MKRKTTIQDIARKADVSASTVSNVLNNHPNIKAATRERVVQAMKELDYRPSFSARQMRTGKSQIIGFITDEIATTPFAVDIVRGSQSLAWEHDKLLMMVNSERNPKVEQAAVEMMLGRGVEGIIYATMYHRQVTPPPNLYKTPTVLLDCFVADRSLPSVVPNEVDGGHQATEILIHKGHQRIGFINILSHLPAAIGRLNGYRKALEANHIVFDPALVRESNSNADSGYDQAHALMQLPTPPTAIFCGNDRIAMGVYDALKELGLRIPNDIAVLGFDNQEVIAAYLRPALSTMCLPHYDMGQWAVKHLLEHPHAQPKDPVQEKIICPYIERESA